MDWNLSKLPPKGHPETGQFTMSLFDAARLEKEIATRNAEQNQSMLFAAQDIDHGQNPLMPE